MNRDRRKVVANIFADAAKYVLTAGIIGSFVSGKFSVPFSLGVFLLFALLTITAYFVMPKDKEE